MAKLWLLMVCILFFTGCKKEETLPESFLTAKIGGKTWNANVANSEHTNVAAIKAQQNVALVGVQENDTEKTALLVIFPENIAINQEIELNPLNQVILAYSISDTEGYLADPAQGGGGTLTVTSLDKEHQLVAGTFSGEAVHTKNGSKIKIERGQFRSKLYTAAVTTPKPGKK